MNFYLFFPDENFEFKHTKPGMPFMSNTRKVSNRSLFFINTVPTSWLDGVHVVFGGVNFQVVRGIEAVSNSAGRPKGKVTIEDSGPV